MSKVTIEEIDYNIKATFDEVLLEDAIQIAKVPIPKKLKNFYKYMVGERTKKVKLGDNDYVSWGKYSADIIQILSDIPLSLLNTFSPEDRIKLYMDCNFETQVLSILFDGAIYEPKGMEGFEMNGIKFILPKSAEIMGEERPMFTEPFITWSEVDDVIKAVSKMENGLIEAAKHIASIMARPEGEEYNEATSLSRADDFLKAPMSIIWEVFFCTQKQLAMFSITSAYKAADRQKNKAMPHVRLTSDHSAGLVI